MTETRNYVLRTRYQVVGCQFIRKLDNCNKLPSINTVAHHVNMYGNGLDQSATLSMCVRVCSPILTSESLSAPLQSFMCHLFKPLR